MMSSDHVEEHDTCISIQECCEEVMATVQAVKEEHVRAERAERSIADMQEVQATWEQELAHMGQAHTEQVRLSLHSPSGQIRTHTFCQ